MLRTIEHDSHSCDVLQEAHVFALPLCCPISKNPRPGSSITINYRPRGRSLEVGSLYAYLHAFVGGLRDDQGNIVVRDIESMVCRIAQDCMLQLRVEVEVKAQLLIVPRQTIELSVKCGPGEAGIVEDEQAKEIQKE